MNSKFSTFINKTSSQKEVSLVIARDTEEQDRLIETMHNHGFRQVIDTGELFEKIVKPSKVFYVIRQGLPKDIYDFLLQYPTGQIEILNKQKMRADVVSPDYDHVSVVFITTKEHLLSVQEKGFDVLGSAGIAYQS